MKILRTFSGHEFIVEDDEAKNIVILKNTGKKSFVELRCGDFIDISAIESIVNPPLIPMIHGYPVEKDGRTFIRDGDRIKIENLENIYYSEDPKYKKLMELSQQRKLLK